MLLFPVLQIGKENPNLQKLIDAFDSIKTKVRIYRTTLVHLLKQ